MVLGTAKTWAGIGGGHRELGMGPFDERLRDGNRTKKEDSPKREAIGLSMSWNPKARQNSSQSEVIETPKRNQKNSPTFLRNVYNTLPAAVYAVPTSCVKDFITF